MTLSDASALLVTVEMKALNSSFCLLKDLGMTKSLCARIIKKLVPSILLAIAFANTLPVSAESFWLKCPEREGYIIGLDAKGKSFTLNDWFFVNRDSVLRIGGDWFHGVALFKSRQIEIVFTQTMENEGKRYAWKKRFLISRIDLGFQEFYSEKINDGEWSRESPSYNTRGICVIAKKPIIRNKI